MVVDRAPVPRLALSVEEVCASLGVSWKFYSEHVQPELRVVRRGRKKLVSVTELERWLDENAELVLEAPCVPGYAPGPGAKNPANDGARDRRGTGAGGGP